MSGPFVIKTDVGESNVFSDTFAAPDSSPQSPFSIDHSIISLGSDVIPSEHPSRHRTLILCFDGTGDQFNSDNSNVVQFVSMLKKDDRRQQMVYYQAGIGTYTKEKGTFSHGLSKLLDLAIAWDLASHTKSGYEFLMENYHKGDKICIFGFSRGAYTARALAGMLTKVGLLPPGNHEQVGFAFKMYAREDKNGWEQSRAFKKSLSVNVEVDFLGVWDTVNSVGLIPSRLPFTISNSSIRCFRHAVSLDERRAKFKASLWPPEKMESRFTDMIQNHRRMKKEVPDVLMELEKEFSDVTRETDTYEVWFAGCHCDVGGGAVLNDTPYALSRISLRWMIRQCFVAGTGILFHGDRLKTIGLDPATLFPVVKPRPPPVTLEKLDRSRLASENGTLTMVNPNLVMTEEEHDLADALTPLHDELKLSKSWWILEILPMKQRMHQKDDSWLWQWTSNMGGPRYLPQGEQYPAHLHRTVRIKMETELNGKRYTPKASPVRAEPAWVE